MSETNSFDSALLNKIHLQITGLLSKLDEKDIRDEEFKHRVEKNHDKLETSVNNELAKVSKRLKSLEDINANNKPVIELVSDTRKIFLRFAIGFIVSMFGIVATAAYFIPTLV